MITSFGRRNGTQLNIQPLGQVRADLFSTIDMFEESELAFMPFEGSRPIGQIMLHIAECEDNCLHGVVRDEFNPWMNYRFDEHATKVSIKEMLKKSQIRTMALLESINEDDLD